MISVALCTYNGEKYIAEQLYSILHQTVPIDEIVIVDDCSNDNTVKIINNIYNNYSSIIKLFINDKNIGFIKNFEKAVSLCKGDYIFLSDQDDVWRKDKVERIINYMSVERCYGVFTDGKLIDGDGKELGSTLFKQLNFDQYIRNMSIYPDLFTTLCLSSNFVTGATMAITKEAIPLILPFQTSRHFYHDSYIAIKLSAKNKFRFIDDALISYRIHLGQEIGLKNESNIKERLFDVSNINEKKDRIVDYLISHRMMAEKVFRECGLSNTDIETFNKTYYHYIINLFKKTDVPARIKYAILLICEELKCRMYRIVKH